MMMMVFNISSRKMTIHVKIHILHSLLSISIGMYRSSGFTISGISNSTPPDPLT